MGTVGFHPEMARGLSLQCTCRIKMPGDDVRKAALATQYRAIGLPIQIILEDILEYRQPDDIMRMMDEEKAKAHPLVQAIALLDSLVKNNSPYVPIVLKSVQEAVMGQMRAPAGAAGNGPPGFQPPQQAPMLGAMGQDTAPLPSQGYGEVPGTIPQNQSPFPM
jgi:hypothetical protein